MSKHFKIYIYVTVALFMLVSITAFAEKPKLFIITIVDTGIDLKNKELVKYLWTNPGETGLDKNGKPKSNNKIDDDGNGLIDDTHGWNFYEGTSDLQDHHGHGTHIAGIILNELKKLKIEKHFRFQILKYFDSEKNSLGLMKASNRSIQYAIEHQSQLINYSGGGYEANQEEERLMKELKRKNIPLVAAVGNQNLNTDQNPFYPSSYDYDNIFAIGAAGASQSQASFSNHGKKHLDFLTPGVSIESYGLNDTRAYLSGTSQSTAAATAMIAYIALLQDGQNAQWTEIKTKLKSLRALSVLKNQRKDQNPNFIDIPFIQRHKTAEADAFGDPVF